MRNIVYLLFISFSAGIVAASIKTEDVFLILSLTSFVFVISVSISLFSNILSRKTFFVGITLACVVFSFGFMRMHSVESSPAKYDFSSLVGKKSLVKGLIVKEPDIRDSEIMLTLQVNTVNNVVPTYPLDILILAAPGPPYAYGDLITAEGKLVVPKNFKTENGTTFDYVNYLAKDNIFYQMKMPTVKTIATSQGNTVLGFLFNVKKYFVAKTDAVIPYPESALLNGLLFGSKRSLGKNLLSAFQIDGVSHMIVVSGYNISLVGTVVASMLSFLSRTAALFGGAFSVILFVAMTGFSGASLRAAIMTLISVTSLLLRRNYDSLRALCLAGFFMIVWNPMTLLYDQSFQYSFLATLGIILLPKRLEKILMWLPKLGGIRQVAAVTLSSQIILLPILLYTNGFFSLYSLPANILVLFPVPFTMLSGFLTGIAGYIGIYISIPFAFVSFLLLSYVLGTVVRISELPLATIALPFSLRAMIVTYCAYILFFFLIHYYQKKKKIPE